MRQEEPFGCVVATLAMLTGKTYAEVRAAFPGHDFRCRGVDPHEAQFYLSRQGYAIAQRWHSWYLPPTERWVPEPFAPLHLAQVDTVPNGGCHMVVVLGDGTVLDPATPTPRTLADFCDVHLLAAVVPVPCPSGAS